MQHFDLFNMALYSIRELDKLQRGENFNNIPLRNLARRIEKIPEETLRSRLDNSLDILYEAITGKTIKENNSIIPLRKDTKEEEVFGRLAVQARLALQELYTPENLSQERRKNLIDFCSKLCDICKQYIISYKRPNVYAA